MKLCKNCKHLEFAKGFAHEDDKCFHAKCRHPEIVKFYTSINPVTGTTETLEVLALDERNIGSLCGRDAKLFEAR